MDPLKSSQVVMHADFFDRCEFAIENGFYIEAVILEYAAIESRLESICGQLGFPCGQKCEYRKDINISSRIGCLKCFWAQNYEVMKKSKIPAAFFAKGGELNAWIKKRNILVHGLYKDAFEYFNKLAENKKLAENGLTYARLLYNEANRIHRMRHSGRYAELQVKLLCKNKKCKAYQT